MAAFRINRTNDAVFKAIFAKYPKITLSLINAFLEFQGTEQLVDIEFIDRELDSDEYEGKESRLDSLKRTVAINILGFNLFNEKDYSDMHSCFGIYDIKTKCQLTDKMEIHFLELLKYKSKNVKDMTRMEKWAAYFSPATTDEELEEIAASEEAIKEAMEVEDMFTKDEVARRSYEKAEKFRRDQAAQLEYAEMKGHGEGKIEGQMLERLDNIKNLMNNLHFSAEKAMEALGIPAVDFPKYREQL